MKNVMLREMRLINFGCFADYSIEFAPTKNVIAGANGTGKTTIADAFSWVFTDKLMNGTTADVRRHDENGVTKNHADTIVTVYVTVDGADYIFEKLCQKTPKGNANMYSVNGVQMYAKQFREQLIDLFGASQEQIGYCISAAHFLKNDTATRRSILFELADLDGDEKLAADSEEFAELAELFHGEATIDDYLKACRAELNGKGKGDKGLNGALDNSMARLNELNQIPLPKTGATAKYIRNRIQELVSEGADIALRLVEVEKRMDMLKRFAEYKTEKYSERINSMFGMAEFVFTEPTNTGDPKDICDLRYKGERYGKRLNTGARALMECDIVKGFQREYGVELPLFIDNAESLTMSSALSARGAVSQYIALLAEDCKLTIEH